jgi:hypothetical protein
LGPINGDKICRLGVIHTFAMVSDAPVIDVPPEIKVGRVYTRPVEARNFTGDFDDIRAWLAGPARRIAETVELLDELC